MVPKCCHNSALISLKYQHIVTQITGISPRYNQISPKYCRNTTQIYYTNITGQVGTDQVRKGQVRTEQVKKGQVSTVKVGAS